MFCPAQDQLGTSRAAFLRTWEPVRGKRQRGGVSVPCFPAPCQPRVGNPFPPRQPENPRTRERAVRLAPPRRAVKKSHPENRRGFGQSTVGVCSTECLSFWKKFPDFFLPPSLIQS